MELTIDNLYMRDEDKELKITHEYYEKFVKTFIFRSIYWGQRKNFFAELFFINLKKHEYKLKKFKVLYIGAAPGTHISFLASLFPGAEFHLYDPRKFDNKLTNIDNIILYNKFFTDDDAESWSVNNKNMLYISDIRASDIELGPVGELDVLRETAINIDMENQKEWLKKINPLSGVLKYRLNYLKENNYLDGIIYHQIYYKPVTGELRLIVDRKNKWIEKVYDFESINDKIDYRNLIMRRKGSFLNPFTKNMSPVDGKELLNDYDSIFEALIWIEYIKLYRNKEPRAKDVIGLSRALTKSMSTIDGNLVINLERRRRFSINKNDKLVQND